MTNPDKIVLSVQVQETISFKDMFKGRASLIYVVLCIPLFARKWYIKGIYLGVLPSGDILIYVDARE